MILPCGIVLLLPWSRVLEKPIVSQLVNIFLTFCGNQMFITVCKLSCHLAHTLSQANTVRTFTQYFCKIHSQTSKNPRKIKASKSKQIAQLFANTSDSLHTSYNGRCYSYAPQVRGTWNDTSHFSCLLFRWCYSGTCTRAFVVYTWRVRLARINYRMLKKWRVIYKCRTDTLQSVIWDHPVYCQQFDCWLDEWLESYSVMLHWLPWVRVFDADGINSISDKCQHTRNAGLETRRRHA
jgi:hypothetical protein